MFLLQVNSIQRFLIGLLIFKCHILLIQSQGLEVFRSSSEQQIPAGAPFNISCRGRKPFSQNGLPEKRLSWLWIPDKPINGQTEVPLNQTSLPPILAEWTENKYQDEHSDFIYITSIKWASIPIEASGTYRCSDLNNNLDPSATTRLEVFYEIFKRFPDLRLAYSGYRPVHKAVENWDFSDKIYNKGDEFQLSCEGTQSLVYRQWNKVRRGNDNEFYKESQTKPLNERWSTKFKSDKNYWITTTITNASYLDTGYYFCFDVYKFTEVFSWSFIFVEDSLHLVLPPALRPVGVGRELRVIGYYGEPEEFLIGCGPTHPKVQVFRKRKNTTGEFKTIASSLNNDEKSNWRFSIHQGFLLKKLESWEMKGEFVCEAKWSNQTTATSATKIFQILIKGVEIIPLKSTEIAEGDELTLSCKSRNIDYVKLSWQWKPSNSERYVELDASISGCKNPDFVYPYEIETIDEEYPPLQGKFKVLRIRIKQIQVEAAGTYKCSDANDLDVPAREISITVSSGIPVIKNSETEILEVQRSNVGISMECELENVFNMTVCHIENKTTNMLVKWLVSKSISSEDEIVSNSSSNYTISTTKDEFKSSRLTVHRIDSQAKFSCVFINRLTLKQATKIFYVYLREDKTDIIAGVIPAIVLSAFVMVIVHRVIFIRKLRQQKRMYQELVNSRQKLLEGNMERIDSDKPLEDQIDLLPYDPKYEFPIDKLILGKQLGVGQFGRVVQAEAIGLGPSGCKTVAVKMVKSETDHAALSSLASELKILIHLGSHLNVVNLLGACTKNISKGELLIIVEFCRYGNLKNFLIKNRSNFIEESIDNFILDCQIKGIGTTNISTATSTTINSVNHEKKQQQKEECLIAIEKKKDEMSRKSTICVHDLLNWSFQIACGMNYVTKKMVMHGDLAARNILLADDDVVKIADFGLSRQLYQNCNYEKEGEEALPVKWMAIESLIDRVFSSKSDVWSYGVTIWEIFTLGQQPYPDQVRMVDLIRFLSHGKRLEKPEHAPQPIGKIMSDCWKQNPDERVTFAQLEQILGQLVDENTLQRIASDHNYDDSSQESNSTNGTQDYLDISTQVTEGFETLTGEYENVVHHVVKEPSEKVMDREFALNSTSKVFSVGYSNPSFNAELKS